MNLNNKIKIAYKLLENRKNIDEKILLSNYINSLTNFTNNLTKDSNKKEELYKCSSLYTEKMLEKMFYYDYEMIQNFIENKEFHQHFLDQILTIIEEEQSKLPQENIKQDTKLSKKEFYYILRNFMKSINKEELLDKIINNNRIHKININNKDTYKTDSGYIIYNHLNKEYDIFIKDFSYTIHSMLTLVHEIGHAYDYETLECDCATYNKYYFQSYYGEVYSKMFERLLISYMLKHNIEKEKAISLLVEFENNSFASISFSYILSCLENNLLCNSNYDKNKKKKIANKISEQFTNKNVVNQFIKNYHFMMIPENYNYAYGNIISLFLKNVYEEEGLSSNLLKKFSQKRVDIFNKEELDSWDITPNQYSKLYQKEIYSIKK